MTTSIAEQVGERRAPKMRELRTFAGDLRESILAQLERSTRIKFPSDRFRADPVAYCRLVLGVDPWGKQVELLEAVRDHARVAVSSGHKVSKSHTAACLALWYYCSYADARVVMTSTTSRQVDQILWRELRMVRARSGRCVECKRDGVEVTPCPHSTLIEGDQGELARTGLKSSDFREVVGFTAREAEAVAGISGAHLLYIVDEASGVGDDIFEAIEGNRAGGARIVMFSNPTRNEGEHFEAFHGKKHLYKTITISSEETPNVVEGRIVIPGLATREWIEEKKQEWGEDSAQYMVRVKGKHATKEEGKIFSLHTIVQAEQRWPDAPDAGRLFIGLDPAGPSGANDETVFCVRRGLKALSLHAHRALDETQIAIRLLELLKANALPREKPVVVLDREGDVGSKVYYELRELVESGRAYCELVPIRASDRSPRDPMIYDRMRDALAGNLEAWFREGGAIPEDAKLSAELHCLEWKQTIASRNRMKLTPKEEIRKALGRSPDRFDALALAVWESPALLDETDDEIDDAPGDELPAHGIDPYAASATWGGAQWRK